jgi:hypothetical protein
MSVQRVFTDFRRVLTYFSVFGAQLWEMYPLCWIKLFCESVTLFSRSPLMGDIFSSSKIFLLFLLTLAFHINFQMMRGIVRLCFKRDIVRRNCSFTLSTFIFTTAYNTFTGDSWCELLLLVITRVFLWSLCFCPIGDALQCYTHFFHALVATISLVDHVSLLSAWYDCENKNTTCVETELSDHLHICSLSVPQVFFEVTPHHTVAYGELWLGCECRSRNVNPWLQSDSRSSTPYSKWRRPRIYILPAGLYWLRTVKIIAPQVQ